MAEYIDREALIKTIRAEYCGDCDCGTYYTTCYMYDGLCYIEDAPAADVVEVVRCKDCKHWDFGDCYRQELTRPDDFCSYGERKEQ